MLEKVIKNNPVTAKVVADDGRIDQLKELLRSTSAGSRLRAGQDHAGDVR